MRIIYQVYISTLSNDLKEEKNEVSKELIRLNCLPLGSELISDVSKEARFKFAKNFFDYCDYFVLIFGGKYGVLSLNTITYMEWEYNYAIKNKIPTLVLMQDNLKSLPKSTTEASIVKRKEFLRFREKLLSTNLVKFWKYKGDLSLLVANSMMINLQRSPRAGWIRGDEIAKSLVYKQGLTLSSNSENGYSTITKQQVNSARRSKRHRGKSVFISYAKEDIRIVEELYTFLVNKGYRVWLDKHDLIPGQDWEVEIHKVIENADFFVACLSTNSVSKRGYVQTELKKGLDVLKQFPEDQIYLIPLRIEECEVPSSLKTKQWLDWSAPNAKEQLLKAIKFKKGTS